VLYEQFIACEQLPILEIEAESDSWIPNGPADQSSRTTSPTFTQEQGSILANFEADGRRIDGSHQSSAIRVHEQSSLWIAQMLYEWTVLSEEELQGDRLDGEGKFLENPIPPAHSQSPSQRRLTPRASESRHVNEEAKQLRLEHDETVQKDSWDRAKKK
jgi:hypothetical protein